MSGLSFWDRMEIEWAVLRVDYDLDARVPRARRRQILNELRSNLTEAATAVGARTAVRQLGDLHTLAMSYVDVYRGRWDFRTGVWAAVVVYAAVEVIAIAVSVGFSSGVAAAGGHAATYSFWSSFGPFAGSASSNQFTITILSPAHLALMALAFAIGSAHRVVLRH